MARTPRLPGKKARADLENVCSYCLFFQRYPGNSRRLEGNCAYFKEWIENAGATTCSDMSSKPLKERGIYRLVSDDANGLSYLRREERLRPRLYLIKGFKNGKRDEGLKGLRATESK